ncbi:phage tail tube protein (plasmid) [Orbus sturtevantii]|uniref:phage tail tube protein n=1 Tax=Orbus sturtevantii TaxID=3074109 RepID=UPI00370D5A22
MTLLAGTAYVTIDGQSIMVVGNFKYQASKIKRETLVGMDGVHGYKETHIAPFISCDVRDSGGTTVADFNKMVNVTISVELANGKMLTGSNMWSVETQEVSSDDAVFSLKFEGGSLSEG